MTDDLHPSDGLHRSYSFPDLQVGPFPTESQETQSLPSLRELNLYSGESAYTQKRQQQGLPSRMPDMNFDLCQICHRYVFPGMLLCNPTRPFMSTQNLSCNEVLPYTSTNTPRGVSLSDTVKANPKRKPRSFFSEQDIGPLQKWLQTHSTNPYPTKEEKRLLMIETGLTRVQISNWFVNTRRRLATSEERKPLLIRDMCNSPGREHHVLVRKATSSRIGRRPKRRI